MNYSLKYEYGSTIQSKSNSPFIPSGTFVDPEDGSYFVDPEDNSYIVDPEINT